MVRFWCTGAWSVIIFGQFLHTCARRSPAASILQVRSGAFSDKHTIFSSSRASQSASMSKPDSASWIQSRLGSLYEARENEAFVSTSGTTFDAIFSPSCEVRMNHTPSTVDAFKESISSHRAAAAGVTLSWENIIATSNGPDEPSVVAGTLIVNRAMKFRIRAAPAQRQTHINFSARVEQEAGAQADDGDRRRITSFYYTSVDKTPPIHFATPHVVSHDEE